MSNDKGRFIYILGLLTDFNHPIAALSGLKMRKSSLVLKPFTPSQHIFHRHWKNANHFQLNHCHKIYFWFSLASDAIHDYLSPRLRLLPVLYLFLLCPPSFQSAFPYRWFSHSPQAHYCVAGIGGAQLIVTLWERYESRKRDNQHALQLMERKVWQLQKWFGRWITPACQPESSQQT